MTTTWQGLLATFTEEMNGLLLATFVVDGAVGVHTKIKGEGDRPPFILVSEVQLNREML
ncbi:MAG: hypothetical protein AAF327_23500 [Cyanobacteria bacterium P01_A01_bin.37]